MAKPVEFESDRIYRWERSKRFVIPAIALGIVIIGAIAAALIIEGSRGKKHRGGEDTPYPYVWTENKDGSVLLEIEGVTQTNYRWDVSEESTGIELFSDEEESEAAYSPPALSIKNDMKPSAGKTPFLLTPVETGRAVLILDLRNKDDEQDRIYEMTVLAEVSGDNEALRASLISVRGAEQQGVIRGGQESLYPYTASLNEVGDLLITVTHQSGEEGPDSAVMQAAWECSSENEEIASVLGVLYGEDDVTAYVRPGSESGRCTIRMFATDAGTEITLDCEVRDDGTILILSHNIAVTEPAASPEAGPTLESPASPGAPALPVPMDRVSEAELDEPDDPEEAAETTEPAEPEETAGPAA